MGIVISKRASLVRKACDFLQSVCSPNSILLTYPCSHHWLLFQFLFLLSFCCPLISKIFPFSTATSTLPLPIHTSFNWSFQRTMWRNWWVFKKQQLLNYCFYVMREREREESDQRCLLWEENGDQFDASGGLKLRVVAHRIQTPRAGRRRRDRRIFRRAEGWTQILVYGCSRFLCCSTSRTLLLSELHTISAGCHLQIESPLASYSSRVRVKLCGDRSY